MSSHNRGPRYVALLAAVSLAAGGLVGPATSEAGAQELTAGVSGNWSSDFDFGVGGRLNWNIPNVNLEGVGSLDIYAPDRGDFGDFLEINGNVFYHFHLEDTRSVVPYLGGGLNISRIDVGAADNTEAGLNLGGGVKFPSGNLTPFVEGRGVVSDHEHFVLSLGLLFGNTGYR